MSAYTQFVRDQFAVLSKTLSAKERMIEIAKLWREKKGDTTGAKPRVKKVVIKEEKIEPVVAVKAPEPVAAVAEVKPKKKRASKKTADDGVFFLPLTKEIPCN